jgi:RNA polymerase sigma-70 factor (ECF subfamily)
MGPIETDADLVQKTLRGRTEAFHQLTERYYRPVGGFILKRVLRADLVEDLVQETFLEAFQALKAGRMPEHFSSWLFGIAHNRCGKWLRRKRPVLFDLSTAPELPAFISDQELREEREELEQQLSRVRAQLQKLPEETRQLLEWKHRDGKTCAEIAAASGKPVGTIKSLLSRTYRWLRETVATPGGANP